jgi:hypothetical protein
MLKYNSVPAYSFTKAKREAQGTDIPGPGAYDIERSTQVILKADPATALIKAPIGRPISKTIAVGPGQYELSNDNFKIKGYYFTTNGKNVTKNENSLPGPGQYDVEKSLEKVVHRDRRIVFNKSTLYDINDKAKQIVPGPGQYCVDNLFSDSSRFRNEKGHKFRKSRTNELSGNMFSPGPGTYEKDILTDICQTHKGYSIPKSKQRPDSGAMNIPGPGYYIIADSKLSNGSKFGKDPRKGLAKNDAIPGPGLYDLSLNSIISKKSPIIKFGKDEGKTLKENFPGPGMYELKTSAFDRKGPAFATTKRELLKENHFPGPGDYELKNIYKKKYGAVIFGKDPRTRSIRIDSPGPGAYNLLSVQQNNKSSIPKAARLNDILSNAPGPGDYDPKNENWNHHFPKFGNVAREKLSSSNQVGPGSYQIPTTIPDVPKYNYPDTTQRKIKY